VPEPWSKRRARSDPQPFHKTHSGEYYLSHSLMGTGIRRREFIAALGGATAWPFAAQAQGGRVRQIAMLSEFSEAQMQPLVAAFADQLQRQG
jgi:hypothetical protein